MDRTPYRRVTPSRRHHGAEYQHEQSHQNERDDTVSLGETLIMQCIICGIIMVFVLIASMTDIGPAASVRNGIHQVLTGAETLDELIADVMRVSNDWLGWQLQPEETTQYDFYIPTTGHPEASPAFNIEQTALPETEHLPPSADQQASNPTVPEPTVTPGLWD